MTPVIKIDLIKAKINCGRSGFIKRRPLYSILMLRI